MPSKPLKTPLARAATFTALACWIGIASAATNNTQATGAKVVEASNKSIQTSQDIATAQTERDQAALPASAQSQQVGTDLGASLTHTVYGLIVEIFKKYTRPEDSRNPAVFIRKENEAVLALASTTCDPRIVPPLGKNNVESASGALNCTPEQLVSIARQVSGRKTLPPIPVMLAKTDTGEALQNEINVYNSRISIIETAVISSISPKMDELLDAYQALSESPDVEAINAAAGNGAAARHLLFQKQIKTQLLIQAYRQIIERNRVLAVDAARGEHDHYLQIAGLYRNLANQ
ncbi:hypothetical protein [Geopseudomonas aromaticivorans]